ncbi:penicillin acylase family protein [Okibacterium endophyticum]
MVPKTPRARRSRTATGLLSVIGAIAVLGIVASILVVWTVQRPFPRLDGELDVPGLTSEVTVYRDDAGIPQLVASTAEDLFLAQGFVHAQDRFWEMDFRRHVTSGRLSELFGESQVGTDTFVRTLGWRHVAEQEVEMLSERDLGYYQAYADGVNAYLEQRTGPDLSLEYSVLALQNPGYTPEPWTPVDSVAWLKAMAWDMRSNLESEVDRAILSSELTPEQVADLYPSYPSDENPLIAPGAAPAALESRPWGAGDPDPGDAVDDASGALSELHNALSSFPDLLGDAGNDLGSNSWVVSGDYTNTGMPLLANDPHLGPSLPSIWYQMGLHCAEVTEQCPFEVAGYTFSGTPGVVIGHNASIAWGFTNLGPDVSDLYIERVTGDGYELDGVIVPFEVRTETIAVAGGEDVTIDVRSTGRGPIVTGIDREFESIGSGYPAAAGMPEGEYELSLQWTALTPGRTASAIFAVNLASDWSTFREASRLFEVPAQNLVYADTAGNIGYQMPGVVPVRRQGDGTLPQPGWTSAAGWSGSVPFESLPNVQNPVAGYIATANNAVVGPDYPVFITRDWDAGYRASRISMLLEDLIGSDTTVTAGDMRTIQTDTHNAMAERIVPVLTALTTSGRAADGQRLLAEWDRRDDASSAASAYFNVFWKTLLENTFAPKLPEEIPPQGSARWFQVVGSLLDQPDSPWWNDGDAAGRDQALIAALDAAWHEASERMGDDSDRWEWSSLHTLTLRNESFGASGVPVLETLFNRGPYPVGGGSSVVNAMGWYPPDGYEVNWVPSMRMVVDLSDFDRSTWINLAGASGHAYHPNYVDQTTLWQAGEQRAWPFSAGSVAESAENTLVLRHAHTR